MDSFDDMWNDKISSDLELQEAYDNTNPPDYYIDDNKL